MQTSAFLLDLVILFGTAVIVSYVFRKLRMSSIAGFLVAGALVGPHGFGWISSLDDVERMAEIGVMLLLFSIGVEFSMEKLSRMKWLSIGGGALQMVLTGGITAVAAGFFVPPRTAIIAGILVALSSTVIALRLLYERGQAFSPQGTAALAILIFQDLAVVPVMIFLPILTGQRSFDLQSFIITTVVSVIAVVAILLAARFLVPRFIAATISTRSRDVFILSVIVTVLGTSWLTSRAGLSTALGAFVAGIVISESEYSHQVLADALPFRETFNSLFFVSIGMLLDPQFLFNNLGVVLLIAGLVLLGKTALTTVAIAVFGLPLRVALVVGVYLSQIGEFSLVLLTAIRPTGAISDQFDQMALSSILVTMVVTPLLSVLADRAGRLKFDPGSRDPGSTQMSGHTIIIGYGLNGQNVAASLRSNGLPYAILDMNPQTVRIGQASGEPIFYGDAISDVVLERVGMERARCAVFAISDPIATRLAVSAARRLNSDIYIVARTRYISEIDQLFASGADTVITEEFETSLEIIRRVLRRFGYRPGAIDREVLNVRQRRYERLRIRPVEKVAIETGTAFEPFEVEVRKKSEGKSLAELRVRESTGATVIAARKNLSVIPNPEPGYILNEGDHVYVIGSEDQIRRAMQLF